MEGFSWEKIGAAFGSVLIFLGAAFAALRSHNKSDGKPPPQREPTYNEMREHLRELKRIIERHREVNDDTAERIEEKLERTIRYQERMEDRVDNLSRAVERVEAAQRFEHAANNWRREGREPR